MALLAFAKEHPDTPGIPSVILLHKGESMTRLRDQLTAFWSGRAPYNIPLGNWDAMGFWRHLANTPDADVLAVCVLFCVDLLLTASQDACHADLWYPPQLHAR
jgi:hypothetical protein